MICFSDCCFFFFKQKTAYEMVYSDWSSDVCSSDLAGRIVGNARGCIGHMSNSGFGSFLAGVVIGGLIGAAIGLLLAPETGEELRDQVGEFVDGKRAEWDEAINEGKA